MKNQPMEDFGSLHDHRTGEYIRAATEAEMVASLDAAELDGGNGLIIVDDRVCEVRPESESDADADADAEPSDGLRIALGVVATATIAVLIWALLIAAFLLF